MKYQSFSHDGVAFQCPTHLGVYLAVVSTNAVDQAFKEVNCKASIVEYEICTRVEQVLKYSGFGLAEIENKEISFFWKTVFKMIEHFHI